MRLLTLILTLFLLSGISLAQQVAEEKSPEVEKEVAPQGEKPTKEKAVEEEKVKEEAGKAEEEEKSKPERPPGPGEEKRGKVINIEGGFAYINVKMDQGAYPFVTVASGEITNNSGRDFGITKFTFSTYDRRGKLITEEAFHITDFYNGESRPFKATLVDGFHDIKEFKINFVSGVAK